MWAQSTVAEKYGSGSLRQLVTFLSSVRRQRRHVLSSVSTFYSVWDSNLRAGTVYIQGGPTYSVKPI